MMKRPAASLFFKLPAPAALVIALASLTLIAWGDYKVNSLPNVAILCIIPVLIAAASGNYKVLWSVTIAAIVVTLCSLLMPLPGPIVVRTGIAQHGRAINRYLLVFNLLVISTAMHGLIATYRRLLFSRDEHRQRGEELAVQNIELASREEEIGRQNIALHAQAEEVARQSEELRVTNHELTRREKMLESLLALSRELATTTARQQTMQQICRTVTHLVSNSLSPGEQIAAAILERQGDELLVLTECGFGPAGLVRDRWPFKESFAAIVLSKDRTESINDTSLRPDLQIALPASGTPFRSMLATPVRLDSRRACTLEIYRSDTHAWSEEEIVLIESLAAQTSTSLEASELIERIELEQRRLRTILNTLPIGVAIVNAETTEVRLNPAGAMMLALPAGTPITPTQMYRHWRKYRDGQLVDIDDMTLLQAVRLDRQISNVEREILFSDGRRLTVMMTAAPIHDAGGAVVGGVCAIVDITRLKNLQNELDARRREAEESSQRKSRFLAAVSHDIRTPANAISLLAELMQRTASSPALAEEIPEIAADLKRSALTLVELVSDVLDLTRFDSGNVQLQETIVSLREWMTEDCRPFVAIAKQKNLEFICDAPTVDVSLRVDRVKVSRILGNLISNAIKYTARGSITVSAHREQDGGVLIQVADTGAGIPPEHLDSIFDEFFQLKNSDHDRSRGSGLGLAICRRLVDAMAGKITVESQVDHGSVFTLALPATAVVPG